MKTIQQVIKETNIEDMEYYPCEKELKASCDAAEREYNQYCRSMELLKIKKSLEK